MKLEETTPNARDLVETLIRSRKYAQLEELCKMELAENRKNSFFLANLGLLHCVRNEFDQSEKVLNEAIEADAADPFIHHWKGHLHTCRREFDLAEQSLARALELEPTFARPMAYLANISRTKRQFQKAAEYIEKAKKIEQANPVIFNQSGNIWMDQKKYEQAEEAYSTAIKIDPNFIDAYNNLGNLLKIKGDFIGSFTTYEKALALNPKDPKSINGKGCVYVRMRQYNLAEKYFKDIMRDFPYYSSTFLNQGIIYRTKGKLEEALELYLEVQRKNPYNATAWNFMGNIYLDKKDHQKSQECFEKAVEIDEYYVSGYTSLSNLLKIRKEFEKSEDVLNQGLAQCGEASELFNSFGNLYYDLKDYPKASEMYDRAIEFDKYYSSPYLNKGCIFKIQKNFDKAIEMFDKTLAIYKYSVSALNNKAGVYMDQKDYEQARSIYKETLELDPFYSYPYMNLGNICKNLREFDQAMEYYQKGLKNNPLHLPTLSSRAGCYFSMTQYDEALKGFQELLKIDDKNKYYYSNIGMCYLNMGNLEKALEWMEKGIQMDPKDGGIKFRKGLVLFKLGRDSEYNQLYNDMIQEGQQDPDDLHKNLFNGYKLQVVYMKNKKNYKVGLEICEKILEMDDLDIGTLVDKLYMLNEERFNKKVLELSKEVLEKFPKNRNVLYQQGVAAMFLKDYELGEKCFVQVVKMSKRNISALKNLFVCFKNNLKEFDKLQILNQLKSLGSGVSNHLNEQCEAVREVTRKGKVHKLLDPLSYESLLGISSSEQVNFWIEKEAEAIFLKDNLQYHGANIFMKFAVDKLHEELVETKKRIIKKFTNERIFKKLEKIYRFLDEAYKKKKEGLEQIFTWIEEKVRRMCKLNKKWDLILQENEQQKQVLELVILVNYDATPDEERIMEYVERGQIYAEFLRDFITRSITLDALITEGHLFGRQHYVDCGFNIKGLIHPDFFKHDLFKTKDSIENDQEFYDSSYQTYENFPKKITSFDLLKKYVTLFGLDTVQIFAKVAVLLLSGSRMHQLFEDHKSPMIYGPKTIVKLTLDQSYQKHYNFEIDLDDQSNYISFLIFEKLRGIVEKCVVEQLSRDELIPQLVDEIVSNKFNSTFRKHSRLFESSVYVCTGISYKSFDPIFIQSHNRVDVSFKNSQFSLDFFGQNSEQVPLSLMLNTNDIGLGDVRTFDSSDNILGQKEYRVDMDFYDCFNGDPVVTVERTVFFKEDLIVIPKGMLVFQFQSRK